MWLFIHILLLLHKSPHKQHRIVGFYNKVYAVHKWMWYNRYDFIMSRPDGFPDMWNMWTKLYGFYSMICYAYIVINQKVLGN